MELRPRRYEQNKLNMALMQNALKHQANTPNTMANCIGALVRRRDGDKSVIWMVEIYFYNLNK